MCAFAFIFLLSRLSVVEFLFLFLLYSSVSLPMFCLLALCHPSFMRVFVAWFAFHSILSCAQDFSCSLPILSVSLIFLPLPWLPVGLSGSSLFPCTMRSLGLRLLAFLQLVLFLFLLSACWFVCHWLRLSGRLFSPGDDFMYFLCSVSDSF